MSKTKSGGSSRNGRDSAGRRLGVKAFGGEQVNEGSIILKQRGTKFKAGENVFCAKDHSLHAAKDGVVKFQTKRQKKFTGTSKRSVFVNVV